MSSINIPGGTWLFSQSILLAINYSGNGLPFWVTWFPSLVLGFFIILFILFLIFIFLKEWWEWF